MNTTEKGVVYLVGAGPGDPELLTVRALRLLESADVVLHDDLVPVEVLALVHRHALVTSVGMR
jgi:uroporphyrin-III C-methyltransferase